MADENYSYAPKYVQIQNYILQKIESGEYAAGDKIPSETELARQFDVSRLTVNTAVKELANSGIVERVQGKGTFVRFVPGQSFSSPMAFSGGIKIAPFEHSNNKPHRLLEHGVIKADAALCQKLGLTAENPYVYKIVRCVDVSSEVDEVDYSYVPLSVCKDHTFDCEALKTFFLHDYICRYFNEKPTHIRIFVDTPLTSDMELSLLNAPPEKLFSWDTFLYHGNQVLAVTTTVSMPKENRPFITLEFWAFSLRKNKITTRRLLHSALCGSLFCVERILYALGRSCVADPSCFYKKGTAFGRTENFQRINWDYSQFTSRSSCPTRIT